MCSARFFTRTSPLSRIAKQLSPQKNIKLIDCHVIVIPKSPRIAFQGKKSLSNWRDPPASEHAGELLATRPVILIIGCCWLGLAWQMNFFT